MMGRGANGGCGTGEKPCPISRVPVKPIDTPIDTDRDRGVDLYTQARKALCERSPFDTEDVKDVNFHVANLPRELGGFLSRNSGSRKRHKKTNSEGKKSKIGGLEKGKGKGNIWVETEEYFRELNVEDIDKLYEVSTLGFGNGEDKCFRIPVIGNACNGDVASEATVKEDIEQLVEIDIEGGNEEKGLEWLLGCRSKVYLTSERPSKKRKLLGGDAGLEKLLVVCSVEGSSLCHYCSLGDTGDELNRLIVCGSCGVGVHKKCYGVQDDVDGSWLCSFCKKKSECQMSESERPCVLCPKQGGALKPLSGGMEFCHLFCCQWIPEVYVENTKTMEPIMNVEGIKETRRKLICNLCKVKCGACVRCSNGTCRTSFHPICARDARLRMEIWGKFGCDDVELRAFCPKHSEVQNKSSTQQVGELCITVNKPHKLKIARRNGDNAAVRFESTDRDVDKLGGTVSCEDGLLDSGSKSKLQSECGDTQQPLNTGTIENSCEDAKTSDSLNSTLILKKLIDRGTISVEDVATEIGVSPDSLASNLADNRLVPDLRCKIVKWLQTHSYIGTLPKSLKVKFKAKIALEAEAGVSDDTDAVVSEHDVVPVKSVPPRRRTKGNITILKDNKVICSSKESISEGVLTDEARRDLLVKGDSNCQSKESGPAATEKIIVEPVGVQDSTAKKSPPKHEGGPAKPLNISLFEGVQAEEAVVQADESVVPDKNITVNTVANPSSASMDHIPDIIKTEALSSYYIHPLIDKLLQMQNGVFSKTTYEYDGSRGEKVSPLEASSSSGICCSHQSPNSASNDLISKFGVNLEQLVKARNIGVSELSPVDEVEGELIFYQHRLLSNAVTRKRFSDDLIYKVVKNLPQETDVVRKHNWDSVLVNQYLCELREAKKHGRKERRHKEAQAVLAAATAAAAASSRVSSFRKDTLEEYSHQESLLKINPSIGRAGQQMPRPKETLSKLDVARVSSERNSDFGHSTLDISKEHQRMCDICRRSETILNPLIVCSSCKVAVHLDCYHSVKGSTGPWFCELCEDLLSSRGSGAPTGNSWEKPNFVAECGLCGCTSGAFRKSTDGQWIHPFCAEWVLESTFRRGQVNPIEGMENVSKSIEVCHLCRRKQGVCIKCFYGHCQSMFHPSCARSAGFYMIVRTSGGKVQHKAYCEKHSSVERAKAETHKHGGEELKSLKQIRVELERLRLLCERIIKREKLKREDVIYSHEILDKKREYVALSVLARSSRFPTDVSSESATTSLKGYTDGCKSGSEAIQRSDDITVDSTIAGKGRIKFPVSMDNDRKTDDSSTSQQLSTQNPRERVLFSGKKIPYRPSSVALRSTSDDGGEKQSKYRKPSEALGAERVMTSDQASMRNQRLPKGFVYVPIGSLPNEKETAPNATSRKQLERDDG